VIPDRATAQVNLRYAPGTSAEAAEQLVRDWCEPYGAVTIDSNAPSAPVATQNELVQRLIATGGLDVAPKQAWTPVAEFAAVGVDAVNFGPGDPRYAHTRDEQVAVAALVRSYETLERFACG
jgi:succinyl-diaminopimelate desuccinylase